MINKVILLGNLGSDPEIRKLESGVSVGKFTLATNENYRDQSGEWQSKTTWHNIVVWRFLAERAEQQLKKGSLVYLEGKIQNRKWQDNEGKDHYITEVVANMFRNLTKRDDSSQNFAPPAQVDSTAEAPDKTVEPEEDDLPF